MPSLTVLTSHHNFFDHILRTSKPIKLKICPYSPIVFHVINDEICPLHPLIRAFPFIRHLRVPDAFMIYIPYQVCINFVLGPKKRKAVSETFGLLGVWSEPIFETKGSFPWTDMVHSEICRKSKNIFNLKIYQIWLHFDIMLSGQKFVGWLNFIETFVSKCDQDSNFGDMFKIEEYLGTRHNLIKWSFVIRL